MTLYSCKYHKRKSNKSKSGQGGSIYIPDDCDFFQNGDKLIGVIENGKFVITKEDDAEKKLRSKKQENQSWK